MCSLTSFDRGPLDVLAAGVPVAKVVDERGPAVVSHLLGEAVQEGDTTVAAKDHDGHAPPLALLVQDAGDGIGLGPQLDIGVSASPGQAVIG